MKTIELQVLENERDWILEHAKTESQKGMLLGLEQAISLVEKAQDAVKETESDITPRAELISGIKRLVEFLQAHAISVTLDLRGFEYEASMLDNILSGINKLLESEE